MVGGVTERWKRKVAILLFLSQLALHLCRFDSPLAMLCHFLIHLKEFFLMVGRGRFRLSRRSPSE